MISMYLFFDLSFLFYFIFIKKTYLNENIKRDIDKNRGRNLNFTIFTHQLITF